MISLISPVETWAHRIPAGAKLLALSALTVALFLTDRPAVLAAATLAVIALYLSAGTAFLRQGARHLRMLWPFLLLIALWHGLTGQAQAGIVIALRLLAALALANFVTMTTRLTDMIAVLTWVLSPLRRLGLPTRAVTLAIAMVLRFTPMLVENGQRLALSWRARSPRRPGWRIVVPMAALALDDADHVAEALRARGGILNDIPDGRN
ncbi:energy-coupling factor transporter transmembrane protein EcfT [Paracoccus sp. YIM 132242]|uniref:Energy-coupling factor transporter transmembrane protein EcfT n=1 Tax=Paracoccus lichenicola TaxID=2665644 RepID=A0A6L6HNM8_9RHOB|nr:energy-coupling factor transporter transmembrane protein EcfT [Paracoccus lichenicola]MTE00012.1 energy-coupling factor transporter transmembrane protein EcfT [Paracoccus lichenicola]